VTRVILGDVLDSCLLDARIVNALVAGDA